MEFDLNHMSRELRDIEAEDEVSMYDDKPFVSQDIVERVKEGVKGQAIIISDSPEKSRMRRSRQHILLHRSRDHTCF